MNGWPIYHELGSHTQVTLTTAVVTVSKPLGNANAMGVLIQCLTENVRYRLDNGNPSASVGFQIVAGAVPVLIPFVDNGIKLFPETSGAVVIYQWVRW